MVSENKKARLPSSAHSAASETGRTDRLLSCPDHHHHHESELRLGLESFLASQIAVTCDMLDPRLHRFDAGSVPPISLSNYLSRMIFYLGLLAIDVDDKEIHSDLAIRYIVTSILYLERIQRQTGVQITMRHIHRLLITGILIASKVLDDVQPKHKFFADLGGVDQVELSKLEVAFLQLCDYNVNVDPQLFADTYALRVLARDRLFSHPVEEALFYGAILSPKRGLLQGQFDHNVL